MACISFWPFFLPSFEGESTGCPPKTCSHTPPVHRLVAGRASPPQITPLSLSRSFKGLITQFSPVECEGNPVSEPKTPGAPADINVPRQLQRERRSGHPRVTSWSRAPHPGLTGRQSPLHGEISPSSPRTLGLLCYCSLVLILTNTLSLSSPISLTSVCHYLLLFDLNLLSFPWFKPMVQAQFYNFELPQSSSRGLLYGPTLTLSFLRKYTKTNSLPHQLANGQQILNNMELGKQ